MINFAGDASSEKGNSSCESLDSSVVAIQQPQERSPSQPVEQHPTASTSDVTTATGWCLLGSHTYSVRAALCFHGRVCLFRVRSRKLSDIGAKFRRICRKSGSQSKNMTSDFAPEVGKYPKSSFKPQKNKIVCEQLVYFFLLYGDI